MRIRNFIFVLLIFIIPLILTWYTFPSIYITPITYALWLTMEIGIFTSILYYFDYRKSLEMPEKLVMPIKNYRVAAVVTTYNEDPETVKDTLISVKNAVGDLGTVFLLDDSNKKEIIEINKKFCEENGIIYVHRENRRGYKAGAINDFLKQYSENFDILAIFDVDQRPIKSFFYDLLPFFNDPDVAFVQIPQAYTELNSNVALGAFYQQKPFYEVVMGGRNITGSAFILGSGVLVRISALKQVGNFDEIVVTEDLATSIALHSKKLKSIYVEYPGIWYGEPPITVNAYLVQQGRWSLGTFQSFSKIMNADIDLRKFIDYFSGFLYWLKEGPLTISEILAPLIFLLFRVYVLKVNPLFFILAYYPIFFASLALYLITMRNKQYGLKGFLFHQFLELIMMPAITMSFIAWLLGRKRPFKVTPKGKETKISKFVILNIVLEIFILLSIVSGLLWYFSAENEYLKYSIVVNITWAIYFLFLNSGTFTIYFSKVMEKGKTIFNY